MGENRLRIGCEADIAEGLAALALKDSRLRAVIDRAGPVPLRLRPPGLAALVDIVLAQMVSKGSAAALSARLRAACDGEITLPALLALSQADSRVIGLSRGKFATLRAVAEAVEAGRLKPADLCAEPVEKAMSALTAIKGIGPWTAEVYLLSCAGHADIFPVGDVALQRAVGHAFGDPSIGGAKALRQVAETWSPWRSVAARLFWAYYAHHMRRDGAPP
ncbi:DNA-3-methyladenine glycosylase family protein [Pseudohoeflea coraliihabitans]|uniref:DNA-3-methyladenine glycosylase II n=1 Tax=Pseudohoeflea coraliihabitans TaxID=2860393 RepID=A0ABS6WKN1_9HYPH|nr:DNA-3-methyladenine glycosylase 2 family protein [Pseudohoeflea sp. DP4N28-3]MBW3096503.1 DNA-3-methyladenine glycosylase 2 family protein [Pseudohoeflea sp. DP4N28-3]